MCGADVPNRRSVAGSGPYLPGRADLPQRVLEYPHATPATSTDTSDDNRCRTPRGLRGSVIRRSSTSRNDNDAPGAVPAGGTPAGPSWHRTTLDQR